MQLFNFDPPSTSTRDRASEQWDQARAVENAEAEIKLLCEQIRLLQQYLCGQLWQQRSIEQELRKTNPALAQVSLEIQQLIEEKLLFLREMKDFSKTLSSKGGTDRRALAKVLQKFQNEIAFSKKLEPVRSNLTDATVLLKLNTNYEHYLQLKDCKKSNLDRI